MEPTNGHLIGFFYMFLLMLQGSLFFTRIHVNRWWTLIQEFLVLVPRRDRKNGGRHNSRYRSRA